MQIIILGKHLNVFLKVFAWPIDPLASFYSRACTIHKSGHYKQLNYNLNKETTEAQLSKIIKNSKPPTNIEAFSLLQPSEMASLSSSSWQTSIERSNRSTTNGDMVEKAKCPVKECVCDIYIIIEKLSFKQSIHGY